MLPKHLVFIQPSLPMPIVYMRQITKRILMSEIFSVVLAQWRTDMSAGILQLNKIRLVGTTSLAVVDGLSPILQ
jgi:hypothetical protein